MMEDVEVVQKLAREGLQLRMTEEVVVRKLVQEGLQLRMMDEVELF